MINSKNTSQTKKSIPILVKISAIIILVVSIIGVLFFATVSLYQLFNPEFLQKFSINNSQYPYLNAYVIIQSIFSVLIFRRWMLHKMDITSMNPLWFLPIV